MDDSIEFMVTTRATYPVPPNEHHYPLMKMEDAFALEAALQAKKDAKGHTYYGNIRRAIHPLFYPQKNPNPYYQKLKPRAWYQGLVGFRFDVKATTDIREAYETLFDIVEATVGRDNPYYIGEVMVSRGGTGSREEYYPSHRVHRPS